jgi:terminase small subunit-like protein
MNDLDFMGENLMPLKNKQRVFVDEYVTDFNGKRAAIVAGYSEKSARFIASENLTKPNIAAAIDEKMKQSAKRNEVTLDLLISELDRALAIARSEGQASAMIAAIMGKAKLMGFLNDKLIVSRRTEVSVHHTIEFVGNYINE